MTAVRSLILDVHPRPVPVGQALPSGSVAIVSGSAPRHGGVFSAFPQAEPWPVVSAHHHRPGPPSHLVQGRWTAGRPHKPTLPGSIPGPASTTNRKAPAAAEPSAGA